MQIRLLPAEQTLKFGDARLGFLEPARFHTALRPRLRFSPAIPSRR